MALIATIRGSLTAEALTAAGARSVCCRGDAVLFEIMPRRSAGVRLLHYLSAQLRRASPSERVALHRLYRKRSTAAAPRVKRYGARRGARVIAFDNLLSDSDVLRAGPRAAVDRLARRCADAFGFGGRIVSIGPPERGPDAAELIEQLFRTSPELSRRIAIALCRLAHCRAMRQADALAGFWAKGGELLRPVSFRALASDTNAASAGPSVLTFDMLWATSAEFRFRTLAWHLCDTHGWDPVIIDALRPRSYFETAAPHEWNWLIELLAPVPLRRVPKLTAVHIRYWEKFGNACQQLANMYSFCVAHGVGEVYFNDTCYTGDTGPFLPTDNGRVRLLAKHPPRRQGEVCLSGTFFFDLPRYRSPDLTNAAEVRDFLYAALKPELRVDEPPMLPSTLVIHLRSGDNFVDNPNPFYGQPPLAFFRQVIRFDQPASVVLVMEDRRNPITDELLAFMANSNVPFRIQSGSLAQDLSTLYAAQRLCLCTSTLGVAVVRSSRHIRRVYSFEHADFRLRDARRLEWLLFTDQVGAYREAVMSNNFANSAAQRELMVSYPDEAIVLYCEPIPPERA